MVSRFFARGKMIRPIASALGAAFLVMLNACGQSVAQPNSGAAGQPSASSGLHVRLDADMFQYTSAVQLCQTLVTAEVVVGSHGVPRWNTPNGTLPATVKTSTDVIKENLRIYTPITFARFATLVDHRHVATKEFLTLGGQVGQDSYYINDVSTLQGTGGHYVVVLYPSTPQSGGNTEVSLVVGHAYPVDAQGIVMLQAAGNSNEPGVGSAQPAITIALTALKQQLAACKA